MKGRYAVLCFLVLAAVVCSPALLDPAGARMYDDSGDFYFTCWTLWWVQHSLVEAHRLDFSTNLIFFPEGGRLYPISLLNSLITLPLYPFLPPAAVFNSCVFLNVFLAGLFSWLFFRHVTDDGTLSLAGAVMFATSPFLLGQVRMGVLEGTGVWWLPFTLLIFLKMTETRKVRWALAFCLSFLALAVADAYYAVCALLFVLCHLAFYVRDLFGGSEGRAFLKVIVLSAAVLAALAFPLHGTISQTCSGDTLTEQSTEHSAEYLVQSGSRDVLQFFLPESQPIESVYLGIPLLLLALVPLPCGIKPKSGPFFLATAAVCFILSLGPFLIAGGQRLCTMPYYHIFTHIAPFQLLNKPYRFILLVYLCLGAYSLLKLSGLVRGTMNRSILAILLSLAFFLTSAQFLPSRPHSPIDASYPDFCAYLKGEKENYAVFEVPSLDIHRKRAQAYFQTLHGKNIAGALTHRYPAPLVKNPLLMHIAVLEISEAPHDSKNPYPPHDSELWKAIDSARKFPPPKEALGAGALELRALGFRYLILNGRFLDFSRSRIPAFCSRHLGDPLRFNDGLLYRL